MQHHKKSLVKTHSGVGSDHAHQDAIYRVACAGGASTDTRVIYTTKGHAFRDGKLHSRAKCGFIAC